MLLFAHGDPICNCTLFADDVAAPVEATVAALRSRYPKRIVATSTAQRLTVINVSACFIAEPAVGTQRIDLQWGATSVTVSNKAVHLESCQQTPPPSPPPAGCA